MTSCASPHRETSTTSSEASGPPKLEQKQSTSHSWWVGDLELGLPASSSKPNPREASELKIVNKGKTWVKCSWEAVREYSWYVGGKDGELVRGRQRSNPWMSLLSLHSQRPRKVWQRNFKIEKPWGGRDKQGFPRGPIAWWWEKARVVNPGWAPLAALTLAP